MSLRPSLPSIAGSNQNLPQVNHLLCDPPRCSSAQRNSHSVLFISCAFRQRFKRFYAPETCAAMPQKLNVRKELLVSGITSIRTAYSIVDVRAGLRDSRTSFPCAKVLQVSTARIGRVDGVITFAPVPNAEIHEERPKASPLGLIPLGLHFCQKLIRLCEFYINLLASQRSSFGGRKVLLSSEPFGGTPRQQGCNGVNSDFSHDRLPQLPAYTGRLFFSLSRSYLHIPSTAAIGGPRGATVRGYCDA